MNLPKTRISIKNHLELYSTSLLMHMTSFQQHVRKALKITKTKPFILKTEVSPML